jgi:hypothetical protein
MLKVFADQLRALGAAGLNLEDPLDPDTKEAMLTLTEVPLLRDSLIEFIRNDRVRTQLREASTRVRNALQSLRFYYEKQLAARGVHPPFATSWESLQERRYENVLVRQQKELPRAFHNALLELSQRTNSDERFRNLLRPTLNGVKDMVQDAVQREIETLLESYGTEYWDDRDVTYDSLVWGTSGIEVPIKRILYQVELIMQESVSDFMPEVADVMAAELERTLEAHGILSRLQRTSYGQEYTYALPDIPGEALSLEGAYETLVERVGESFRHICRQATMYELVRPERSIHVRLQESEEQLALPDNDRVLDAIIHGPDAVRDEWRPARPAPAETAEAAEAAEDEIAINILDAPAPPELDLDITFPGEEGAAVAAAGLEPSYADRLDNIAVKTNRIFGDIVQDLFGDDNLLPRLRRLFWLEATRAERDFNNHVVKPMLRQHDRKLHDEELRKAMEIDLESVSDMSKN